MIQLLDRSKISLFDYLFVFSFFIYAGGATVFARELGDIRTLGNGFALFITVVFVVVNKVRFTKNYWVSIGVFLLYALATAIYYHLLNLWWISVNFLLITYGYVICRGFRNCYFVVFETIIYHLCIISIPFWILYLVFPELLSSIVKIFEFSKTYADDGNVIANMIVYTLPNKDYGNSEFSLMPRNPGFVWEPGAFASIICLGIFCNMMRTNFKLNGNRALWLFLFVLLTTQSTTGLIIFIIMILLWCIGERKYGLLAILAPVGAALFTFPFVRDKLFAEFETAQNLDYTYAHGIQGRFFSLMIDWEEFLHHPILGLGCNFQGTWLNQNGYDIVTISGLGDLLATYGAIIAIIFVVLLVKSSLCINIDLNTKQGWILIAVIIGTMISYDLWKEPLYIAFWMYCVFGAVNKIGKQKILQ